MLITLVIILLLIGAAVVGSIYSNFLVFYSNFNESENYHKAYYNAIAALERSELVIKQRAPGFVGNGGRIIGGTGSEGSFNNGGSDGIISDFSYLSSKNGDTNTSTIFRTIDSKATRIPKIGNGDVEISLSTGDSIDYNMIDYEDAQIFSLYYDKSEGNPYSGNKCPDGCTESSITTLTGIIRLPGFLNSSFGNLDSNTALMNNGPKNDAIINREIRGMYDNSPFTVYATQSSFSGKIYSDQDSVIREDDIRPELSLNFKNNKSPFNDTSRGFNAKLTVISTKENELKSITTLIQLLNNSINGKDLSEKEFRLSLLNLLKTENSMVYPFLEYYIDFGTGISDKYFNINAEGNYGDYKINKIIRKPTNKESVLGSFTTIF